MSDFTPEQQKVIDYDGGNLVVSASAGSGKTTVMVERIINLITQKQNGEYKCGVDKILAVTFTKLASSEMKEKIARAIKEKLALGDENREYLKSQLDKLQIASISTVHSFCANILRTYFYAVGIDSQFTILDDADAKELRQRAVNEVFESLYESDDAGILDLLQTFISHRSDRKLKELILEIYLFATSEKSVDEFLDKSLELYTEEGHEKVVNRLIELFFDGIKEFLISFGRIEKLAIETGNNKLIKYFTDYGEKLNTSVDASSAYNTLVNLSQPNLKRPSAERTPPVDRLVGRFDAFKDKLKKFVEKFKEIFTEDKTCGLELTLATYETVKNLVGVVRLFADKYTSLKMVVNGLDYSDLEHLTLKVLESDELCEEIASQYKYIFVDEYQDTNGIQEEIFSKLERNNLFVVGDVKQSIYAFRGCNPKIFKAKMESCETGYGECINLDDNFRSSKAVLNAVNNVFSNVMTEKNCDYDYAKYPMKGGKLYGENSGASYYHEVSEEKQVKTFGIYSVKKHLSELENNDVCPEAVRIYEIIEHELKSTFYDIKENKFKRIGFGDITILTRSNTGLTDKIINYLVQRGVPVVCQTARSINEYPEIALMINLLEFISSPTRDIPLATVLKSPIGGLNDGELAKIRKVAPKASFYDACTKYIQKQDDKTREKLKDFFDYFIKIRLIAQFETVSLVLKKIIKERGLDLKILSSKLGKVKMARINRFILAGENLMVSEFLSKMESILETLTVSHSEGEDSVKIMSYHASKGLEFPVVILADVSKEFNKQDLRNQIIFDREWGLGVKFYDKENKVAVNTAVRSLLTLNKNYTTPSEEMRLLYVAMTRAKYKLHIIAKTGKISAEHTFENGFWANRMSDFLSQGDMLPFSGENSQRENFDAQPLPERREEIILPLASEEETQKIKQFLQFKYPYESDTHLHLKRTVTAIAQEYSEGRDKKTFAPHEISGEVDPIATGNAYHKFLERCDFEKSADNELIRLLNEEKLSQEEADLISTDKIKDILNLNVFSLIKGAKLYKEQPFILNVPAKKVTETQSEEKVLVQGTIDLLAVSSSGAYVIDYKHSVKDDDLLVATYKKQLELYAYAVEKISGIKVIGTYLVNLNKVREIKVDV